MPWLEAAAMGKLQGRQLEVCMLCDWLGVRIFLTVVGTKLEA